MFRFGVYRVVYPVNHFFISASLTSRNFIDKERKKKSRDHITERGGPNPPRTKALFCFHVFINEYENLEHEVK